jgi:hypothetical protein
VGTAKQQGLGQLSARGHEVLAIVQHQQQVAGGEVSSQRLHRRLVRLLAQAKRRHRRRRNQATIGERRQVHERCVGMRSGRLERQACLADATHSDERDQARGRQEAPDLGHLPLPAHEAAEWCG